MTYPMSLSPTPPPFAERVKCDLYVILLAQNLSGLDSLIPYGCAYSELTPSLKHGHRRRTVYTHVLNISRPIHTKPTPDFQNRPRNGSSERVNVTHASGVIMWRFRHLPPERSPADISPVYDYLNVRKLMLVAWITATHSAVRTFVVGKS